jgi:hypothetical protein
MHDLTMHELDAQLAEQLPARELMGSPSSYGSRLIIAGNQTAIQQQNVGSNFQANGNGNKGFSLGDGALSGNSAFDKGVQVGNVSFGY